MQKEKRQLRNWLLLNSVSIILFANWLPLNSQIANHITNGGFEQRYSCSLPYISMAKGWRNMDSIYSSGSPAYYSTCYPNVPSGGLTYQWPKTGAAFGLATFLCQPPQCAPGSRQYFRNRLKSTLIAGKTYCVKLSINISDPSSYGIDAIGVYFGDNSLDTITKTGVPLTYLTPQVTNSINNIITDTMNWTTITGTFVATGIEKHCVIGNFKSDTGTNKTLINPTILPTVACDVLIDDVSCIPIDLPAYAASSLDIYAIPGNSIYLGRPQDVGVDEACTWYKLPNTTSVIVTAAGFSLTAAATTETYMVKQDICGVIKYDTVIVHASGVGLKDFSMNNNFFQITPNPSGDFFNLKLTDNTTTLFDLSIYNSIGQIVKKEDVEFKSSVGILAS